MMSSRTKDDEIKSLKSELAALQVTRMIEISRGPTMTEYNTEIGRLSNVNLQLERRITLLTALNESYANFIRKISNDGLDLPASVTEVHYEGAALSWFTYLMRLQGNLKIRCENILRANGERL